MEWIKRNRSWLLRFASVISLIVVLVWFLWPSADWKVDPGALVALVTAVGVWLLQEGLNFPPARTPHPHDIKLLREVRTKVGVNQVRFLKKHDLGASFREEAILFLWDIADNWYGVHWEFHDKKLQVAFNKFVESARKLGREIALKSGSTASGRSLTVVPQAEHDWFSEQTRKMVKELNDHATEVASLYEVFERTARERLPEAF